MARKIFDEFCHQSPIPIEWLFFSKNLPQKAKIIGWKSKLLVENQNFDFSRKFAIISENMPNFLFQIFSFFRDCKKSANLKSNLLVKFSNHMNQISSLSDRVSALLTHTNSFFTPYHDLFAIWHINNNNAFSHTLQ
jgi:hypothetical protein